jgi:hypothetical protein
VRDFKVVPPAATLFRQASKGFPLLTLFERDRLLALDYLNKKGIQTELYAFIVWFHLPPLCSGRQARASRFLPLII